MLASPFLRLRTITQENRGYLNTSTVECARHLINDGTTECITGGNIENQDTLDKGVILILAGWGRTAPDSITLLRKVCDLNELFISVVFHFIFLDDG